MAVKVVIILCFALFALASSIKFAGGDCMKDSDCAQRTYSGSKCLCDKGKEEDTGKDYFKRGICADSPWGSGSGSCMTSYKWTKIKKKKGAAPTTDTVSKSSKHKGETCSANGECIKSDTNAKGCICHGRKKSCFGKNCKPLFASQPDAFRYAQDGTCAKKTDCLKRNPDKPGCACHTGKHTCWGDNCLKKGQEPVVKKAVVKKAVVKTEVKSKPVVKTEVKAVKNLKKYKLRNEPCKRGKDKCAQGCGCMRSKCLGFCKARKSSALYGDYGDVVYDNIYDDEMGYVTQIIFMVLGVCGFFICCAVCIVVNVIMGCIGGKCGNYAEKRGRNQSYKMVQRKDVTDDADEQSSI